MTLKRQLATLGFTLAPMVLIAISNWWTWLAIILAIVIPAIWGNLGLANWYFKVWTTGTIVAIMLGVMSLN